MHYILTDEIDSGKSTFVLDLARRLIESGKDVSGWITPAHMEEGEKVGHDLIIIEDGAIRDPVPFTRREPFEGSFPWRSFHFSRRAFDLVAAIDDFVDILIMDEIGPLELEEEEGFMETVRRGFDEATDTISVVRTGLLDRLAEFTDAEFSVFTLDEMGDLMAALDLTP